MKICFPVEVDQGMESTLYGHFGSAPCFIAVDTDTMVAQTISNRDQNHEHGQCNPVKSLEGHDVEAIVVSGIGANAVKVLNSAGIRVYKAMTETVKGNAELIAKSALPEMTIDQTCSGHGHGGGCAHH